MTAPARKPATYADLEAVPPHLVAEIIYGVLETHSRPTVPHGVAATHLCYELIGPFDRGRSGPGGWNFLPRIEFHFEGNVVVPDIASWRRERLPQIPDVAFMTLAPDWVCEVVSPETARLDRGPKRAIYAKAGVSWLWLLDPKDRVLEAFQLFDGQWRLVGVATGKDNIKLPPFDAVSFPFDDLFGIDPPSSPDPTPQG